MRNRSLPWKPSRHYPSAHNRFPLLAAQVEPIMRMAGREQSALRLTTVGREGSDEHDPYAPAEIIEAASADAALEFVESGEPVDLLFTDVQTPGVLVSR